MVMDGYGAVANKWGGSILVDNNGSGTQIDHQQTVDARACRLHIS
jgi:hypothetical protein